MYLKFRRPKEKAEADRQLIIAYKKLFSSEEGQIVFMDLANKFHLLNASPGNTEIECHRAEGARRVILYIISQRHMDLAHFDRLMSGDLSDLTGETRK